MGGLNEIVVGISLLHQAVNGTLNELSFGFGLLTELRCIFAHEVFVDACKHFAGTVAALDRTLVDIFVERIFGSAEERAIDNIHIGIVAGIGECVARKLCPKVKSQSVHGVEVGKGALVRFGHRGKFFAEEKESQRLAIFAEEHIGTLHELRLGDGLHDSGCCDGFVGQLLVLGCFLLEFDIGLLHALHLLVFDADWTKKLLDDGSGERLARPGFAQDDDLEQERMGVEVIHILGSKACA